MAKQKEAEGEDAEMVDDTTINQDAIDRLFGVQLQCTVKNMMNEAEEAKVSHERNLKVSCYIDNNNKPIDSI